jgi:dihydrofolate reductase
MQARAPRLTLIVAVADNGVIGREGGLPWRLSEDLRRFKQRTLGRPVVMGRKTWESLGKPLPGRTNIVITRRGNYQVDVSGVIVARDLDAAIAAAGDVDEVMIIGGAEIYALALPRANLVELTQVHAIVEGDTVFPALPSADWKEISRTDHPADERNQYPTSFVTLQRR